MQRGIEVVHDMCRRRREELSHVIGELGNHLLHLILLPLLVFTFVLPSSHPVRLGQAFTTARFSIGPGYFTIPHSPFQKPVSKMLAVILAS